MILQQGTRGRGLNLRADRRGIDPAGGEMHRDHRRQGHREAFGAGAQPGTQQRPQLIAGQGMNIRDTGGGREDRRHRLQPGAAAAIRRTGGIGHLNGQRGAGTILPVPRQGSGAEPARGGERGKQGHRGDQQRQHAIRQRLTQPQLVEPAWPERRRLDLHATDTRRP